MDVRRRFVELTRFLLGLQESLELSEIFQRCYDGLPACLDVSRVTIMLYDEALGGLVSDQYLGVKHRGEKIVSSIQPVGAYLSGRCFAECRPIAIDDCSVTDLIPARDVGNLKLKRLTAGSGIAIVAPHAKRAPNGHGAVGVFHITP